LAALRDDAESPFLRAGFPELAVPGLDAAAALGLLGDTSMRVVERLVSATGGNPLALVELSSELTAEQLAGSELLAEPLPAIRSIRDAFERRLRALSGSGRAALLVAAASESERVEQIVEA